MVTGTSQSTWQETMPTMYHRPYLVGTSEDLQIHRKPLHKLHQDYQTASGSIQPSTKANINVHYQYKKYVSTNLYTSTILFMPFFHI